MRIIYLLIPILLVSGCTEKEPDNFQVIKMNVTANSFEPNHFLLKKGIPVKWEIDGTGASGCTDKIKVPALFLNFDLRPGKRTIEFTPNREGTFEFSCWMGMVRGTLTVV